MEKKGCHTTLSLESPVCPFLKKWPKDESILTAYLSFLGDLFLESFENLLQEEVAFVLRIVRKCMVSIPSIICSAHLIVSIKDNLKLTHPIDRNFKFVKEMWLLITMTTLSLSEKLIEDGFIPTLTFRLIFLENTALLQNDEIYQKIGIYDDEMQMQSFNQVENWVLGVVTWKKLYLREERFDLIDDLLFDHFEKSKNSKLSELIRMFAMGKKLIKSRPEYTGLS